MVAEIAAPRRTSLWDAWVEAWESGTSPSPDGSNGVNAFFQ
jgi:hypothetical protein